MNKFVVDPTNLEKTNFAAGCFWGVEYHMQKEIGVVSTSVGYMGGKLKNPTYKDVCTSKTGHAEVVEVVWDKSKTNFETLCKLFFEIHDPTDSLGQGPDRGPQYRSEIFYDNKDQKNTALQIMDILKKKGINPVTQVTQGGVFWKAEEYHQDYYLKTNNLPYCHFRRKIF